MATDSVTIVLRAINEATDAINEARTQLESFRASQDSATGSQERSNRAANEGDRQARRLANAINGMTSASGLAATALARVQGLLIGFAQGALIGLAAAAVASLVAQFRALKVNIDELSKSVDDQAAKWDPYRSKLDEVRASTITLYNADLALVQLHARERIKTLSEEIAKLEDRNRVLLESRISAAIPLEERWNRKMLENNQRIASNREEIEELNAVLGRHELTLQGVQTTVDRATLFPEIDVGIDRGDTFALFQQHEQRKSAILVAEAQSRNVIRQAEADAEVGVIGRRAEEITRIETQLGQDRARAQALFSQALGNAVAQAVLGQASLGKALKAGLAQTLAVIAGEAAVRAIFETAMGFAALFVNPAKSAAHFQAAAIFGTVGVAAGAVGAKFAGGGGGGGGTPPGGGTSVPSSAREIGPTASSSSQPLPQTINVYINGNLVDLSQLSRELRPFNIQLTRDTI